MRQVTFEGKSYTISFEAMPQMLKEKLPPDELSRYLKLLEKVQQQPRDCYEEIKAFSSKYPDVPEVLNLLTFAHIQNHRIPEAEKLIEETYKNYPGYLFARINYADQCLRKKKLDLIPSIFPTFDLQELYPEKEVFHTSEFRGFFILMTYYHMALKNREKAIQFFKIAEEIDPYFLGIVYLKKKLFKVSLGKKIKSLFWRNHSED